MLDHAESGIHTSRNGLSSYPMNGRRKGMKIMKLVFGYCFQFYIPPCGSNTIESALIPNILSVLYTTPYVQSLLKFLPPLIVLAT
jgi:hypothetical protein